MLYTVHFKRVRNYERSVDRTKLLFTFVPFPSSVLLLPSSLSFVPVKHWFLSVLEAILVLLCTYFSPSFHLLFTYFSPSFHLLFTYFSPTFHLLFTNFSPSFNLLFPYFSPSFHQLFTFFSPTFHLLLPYFSPSFHQLFTFFSPTFHLLLLFFMLPIESYMSGRPDRLVDCIVPILHLQSSY